MAFVFVLRGSSRPSSPLAELAVALWLFDRTEAFVNLRCNNPEGHTPLLYAYIPPLMPPRLRSSISLQQVVSEGSGEAKVNTLRLAPSAPAASTPSYSPRSSLKRKLSSMSSDPGSVAPHPNSSPPKRSRVPPTPIAIPSAPSSSAIDDGPFNPPSPVPTEIIDVEAEDFVRTAKSYGVKVRDYAVELPTPPLPKIPEVWKNPFLTLLAHDVHIRRPRDPNFNVSGRLLRRLLDIGFVTQGEADAYWTREDRRLLEVYDSRPQGPYPYVIAYRRPKPSAAYRISARKALYGESRRGDIPEEHFKVPDDGTWEGDEESRKLERQGQENKEKALRLGLAIPVLGLDPCPPPPPRESSPKPAMPATPIATPPLPPLQLPEDSATARSATGLLGSSSRANVLSMSTTPPAPSTPTTPTSPPATPAPLPSSSSRRLGRTATMKTITVR